MTVLGITPVAVKLSDCTVVFGYVSNPHTWRSNHETSVSELWDISCCAVVQWHCNWCQVKLELRAKSANQSACFKCIMCTISQTFVSDLSCSFWAFASRTLAAPMYVMRDTAGTVTGSSLHQKHKTCSSVHDKLYVIKFTQKSNEFQICTLISSLKKSINSTSLCK